MNDNASRNAAMAPAVVAQYPIDEYKARAIGAYCAV